MRSEHLVCQHLEHISRDALEKYQNLIQQYVRRRNGVYALYKKNRLYYVGLASNLRSRLKSHLRDRHAQSWDRFSVYLTIGDQHMKELESLILRIVEPVGNKVKGKFKKSQDMRRDFSRNLKELHHQEREFLLGRFVIDDESQDPEEVHPPVLASYLRNRKVKLRAKYRGKTLRAKVRKDGRILYKGKLYDSPSKAGWISVRKAFYPNGWAFWEFERAPGDWAPLDELRK